MAEEIEKTELTADEKRAKVKKIIVIVIVVAVVGFAAWYFLTKK